MFRFFLSQLALIAVLFVQPACGGSGADAESEARKVPVLTGLTIVEPHESGESMYLTVTHQVENVGAGVARKVGVENYEIHIAEYGYSAITAAMWTEGVLYDYGETIAYVGSAEQPYLYPDSNPGFKYVAGSTIATKTSGKKTVAIPSSDKLLETGGLPVGDLKPGESVIIICTYTLYPSP